MAKSLRKEVIGLKKGFFVKFIVNKASFNSDLKAGVCLLILTKMELVEKISISTLVFVQLMQGCGAVVQLVGGGKRKSGTMFRREEKIQMMIEAITADAAATASLTGRARFSPRVMKAMREVPREAFVPDYMESQAFENRPLPIGEGQTISQPYIVALMTDLLDPQPEDIMLEIGTGSGYQAAILAALINKLYSIETIPALASRARDVLTKIDCANVEIIIGDGYAGLPEHAPYDGIIVTAAAPYVPEPLTEQLKAGGKLIIPVGQPMSSQQLLVVKKEPCGTVQTHRILDVAFVPMVNT